MTTKFTSPVFRETVGACVNDRSKKRAIVVGLETGDVISVRLKGTTQRIVISAHSVYEYAMKLNGAQLLAQKKHA